MVEERTWFKMTQKKFDVEAIAKHFVRYGNECEVMDTYSSHEDTFKAGATHPEVISHHQEVVFERVLEMLRVSNPVESDFMDEFKFSIVDQYKQRTHQRMLQTE